MILPKATEFVSGHTMSPTKICLSCRSHSPPELSIHTVF